MLPVMALSLASCEKWTDDSPIIQFKDPKFLEAILSNDYGSGDGWWIIDKNGDGQISEKEAAAVMDRTLDLSGHEIRNMDEIRYFTALTSLICYDNKLTSLDVSKNTALTSLECSKNQLTSLDLSNNTALTSLTCFGNQLTSLDVSKNTALINLACYENQLTSLDLSNNTALTSLTCNDNQLTSLDLSNNTALTDLSCRGNPLQKLIIYKYHIIKYFSNIEESYGDIIEYAE